MINIVCAILLSMIAAGVASTVLCLTTYSKRERIKDTNEQLKEAILSSIKAISLIENTCSNELNALNDLIHKSGYTIEDILQPSEVEKFNKLNENSKNQVVFNKLTAEIFESDYYPITSSKYTKNAKRRLAKLNEIRAFAEREEERVVQAYYVISRNIKNRKAEESA